MKEYLVKKEISASSVETKGFGLTNSVASNARFH
jgi:outer membrane protein OmpA-like peptidoglycan-associated protein